MAVRKVWTKQHKNVLKKLEETGRYTARREYICLDMKEQKDLILTAYDWLSQHGRRQIKSLRTSSIRSGFLFQKMLL